MPQVSKSKTPRSRCIRIAFWRSIRNFKKGERATSGSPGQLSYGFVKGGKVSIYNCTRKYMTFGKFNAWMAKEYGSIGQHYNFYIRGNY